MKKIILALALAVTLLIADSAEARGTRVIVNNGFGGGFRGNFGVRGGFGAFGGGFGNRVIINNGFGGGGFGVNAFGVGFNRFGGFGNRVIINNGFGGFGVTNNSLLFGNGFSTFGTFGSGFSVAPAFVPNGFGGAFIVP